MWVVLLTFGLIKLPIAALMLWIPFRADAAMASLPAEEDPQADSSGEDEGGSKIRCGAGPGPHPRAPRPGRRPRRGPHGEPAPPAPARARTPSLGRKIGAPIDP
jgi:hypothetical protein